MAGDPGKGHDDALAVAFDGQAARFERAPVQTDPEALARLVRFADLPEDSYLLDAGCGPGLVSRAFVDAGHRVVGVDLAPQMIERARARCPDPGRAEFRLGSIYGGDPGGPFDAAVSRYVLHHVADPASFVRRQVKLLRPGGVLVLCDHTTDPDPEVARRHNGVEALRDRTHTANLTAGTILDLVAAAGLGSIRLVEEAFCLDFDEWFDRGTPAASKAEVRDRIESSPGARGFAGRRTEDGRLEIACWRALVRGQKS